MADDKLMVATRTFITTYDGRREVVHKGKSRYRASHQVVKQFPESFKAADHQAGVEDTRVKPGGSRGETSSQRQPRKRASKKATAKKATAKKATAKKATAKKESTAPKADSGDKS